MLGCCWRLCFPGEHLCAAPRPVSCSMTMCTIEWLACPRPGCLLCGACDCTGQGAHCGLGYERHVEVFWWWRERRWDGRGRRTGGRFHGDRPARAARSTLSAEGNDCPAQLDGSRQDFFPSELFPWGFLWEGMISVQ